MNEITIKGVKFSQYKEQGLGLKRDDFITPIWKQGNCVKLLITRANTGEAIYIDTNTKVLYIDVKTRVSQLPQGATFALLEDSFLNVLTTMILINSRN